jgi:catechol 2,3-dioxygenase
MRPGPVRLTVADLGRSVTYYERAVGLRVLERAGATARLGTGGGELLVLDEVPGARPAPRATGLFHFALLVPTRAALARWLAHALREELSLTGASDHAVSEALYLRDPDLHGIEIYADRPRERWRGPDGELLLTTFPLDLEDLLRAADEPGFDGLPDATRMGHVHLQVASVPDAVAFYGGALGLDLMLRMGDQAAFLSTGGYHHDVGVNTWNSLAAGPPPPGAAALQEATLVFPDAAARDRAVAGAAGAGHEPVPGPGGVLVRDPAQIALRLAVPTDVVRS